MSSQYQVPACPQCYQNEGRQVAMDFVPGQVGQTVVEQNGRKIGVQTRQVFCPRCSYVHPQWWAPYRVKSHQCSACGHKDEKLEFMRGGPSDVPTPVGDDVFVDENGYAQGLGIQSVPLQG